MRVAQQGQRVHLVRGAEAVEEMQERHAQFKRGHLRDQRHIVRLLHRCGGSNANPVGRVAITSEWSPKIESAWVAIERAAT